LEKPCQAQFYQQVSFGRPAILASIEVEEEICFNFGKIYRANPFANHLMRCNK
jgi:hypothetical protein